MLIPIELKPVLLVARGHALRVDLLRDCHRADPVSLISSCTTIRMELVLFRPEVCKAQRLLRLGGHRTDNIHLHFNGGYISPELERILQQMDPGFPGARRLPGHDFRIEITRSIK